MAMSYTWNENSPADTDLISGGDDSIRELKKAVRERFDVEHVFTTGNEATVGEHAPGFITEAKAYIAALAVTEGNLKANAVANTKLAQMAGNTFKGRMSSTGDPQDLTVAQVLSTLGLESGSTGDMTAGEILASLLTVDGAGTGLDADLLDGNQATAFAVAAKGVTNGDSHDHSGGDGATLVHSTLSGVGSNTHAQIDTAVGVSTAHVADTTVAHGAVSAATANKFVVRDASGRAAFATPSATGDAATKGYVDGVYGIVETTIAASSGATLEYEGAVNHIHINGATPTGGIGGYCWSTGITGGGAITIALVTFGNVTVYSFTITPSAGTHTIRVNWSYSAYSNPGEPTNGTWAAIAQSFRTA